MLVQESKDSRQETTEIMQQTERTTETTKEKGDILQALLMIDESANECESALAKAECMAQDITDDFFGKVRPDNPCKYEILVLEMEVSAVRARILFDYIREAATHIVGITQAAKKALEATKQGRVA